MVLTSCCKGGEDTLVVPFKSIENLSLSSLCERVIVKLILRCPPFIGNQVVECGEASIPMEWTLKREELQRFLGSLKCRRVVRSV